MRIVGGRFRGRALATPESRDIRPTSDRLRESIFNILAHGYDDPVAGARVIDLFAGTGALGIEALSRGAQRAMFVDDGASARALIRANVEALGLGGVTRLFRRDATKLGDAPPGEIFDLAFLDPPWGHNLAPLALASLGKGGWLAPDALCIVEEDARINAPLPEGFTLVEQRDHGTAQTIFARWSPIA